MPADTISAGTTLSDVDLRQKLGAAIQAADGAIQALGTLRDTLEEVHADLTARMRPVASYTLTPQSNGNGVRTYAFSDASTDPEGDVTGWNWRVFRGDAEVAASTVRNPVFELEDAFEHVVSLVVTDAQGLASEPFTQTIPARRRLPAPANLRAGAPTPSTLPLTWDRYTASGAVGFRAYFTLDGSAPSKASPFRPVAGEPEATGGTLTGLPENTRVSVALAAVDADGEPSELSNVASATTGRTDTGDQVGAIPAVQGAGIFGAVNDSVGLFWTAPRGLPGAVLAGLGCRAFYTLNGSEPTEASAFADVALRLKAETGEGPTYASGGLRNLGYDRTVKVRLAYFSHATGKVGPLSPTVEAQIGPDTGVVAPVFADGVESGRLDAAQNGYRWGASRSGPPDDVAVSTQIAHTGTHSIKFLWAGNARACDDAWAEQRFALGEDLGEVWFEYWLYLPDGTEGLGPKYVHRQPMQKAPDGQCSDKPSAATNNKFFSLWDTIYDRANGGAVRTFFEVRRSDDGTDGDSYLYGLWGTDTRTAGNYNQPGGRWDPAITDELRGRWVQIRIHVRVADSKAAANGVLQLWADGKLRIDMRGLDLAPAPGKNNFFRNGYILGWANSGFTESTAAFVDDFKVYNKDPRW